MSRVGNQSIKIEEGVTVEVKLPVVSVKGPKGELTLNIPESIEVEVKDGEVFVTRTNDEKQSKSNHGTIRALIANMIEGVLNGYEKNMELVGLGYRAEMKGTKLVMHLGWTHPIEMDPPEGVTFEVPEPTKIKVSGIDKNLVGLYSAKIRSYRKPEPYKGKGIRYEGEVVRRKTSKSVKDED